MTERFSLKDHLFNPEKVAVLGALLQGAIPGFDRTGFEDAVDTALPSLELKERIAHIAAVLTDHLDDDFEKAAHQLRAALPPPLDPNLGDGDFGDFIIAPLGKYVEDRGLDHYDTSMDLLRDLTMRFSMEASVRPFIDLRPAETLHRFESWARDPNYHVRRLVSESTRPRLPWAPRIGLEVSAPIPLLDVLHADSTRYVTRSVANHLNDISKVDPDLTLGTLARWRKTGEQKPEELAWIERHALRTLIKQGHAHAMSFLGYPPEPQLDAALRIARRQIPIGDAIEFTVKLVAEDDTPLIVDYSIDFIRADGRTGRRVFKLKMLEADAGEPVELVKKHPLRRDATTYRLHPGVHRIRVLANGTCVAEGSFELVSE